MARADQSFWERCKVRLVPPVSDETLEEMAAAIKPLKAVGNGRFREILTAGVDPRRVAFTWEPKLGRAVRVYRGGLNNVTILTFHTYGDPSLFKPSLAEVYGGIRQAVPNWSPVRFFWLNSEDLDARNLVGGCHWCRCVLFGDEEPHVIDAEWDAFAASCR